MTDKTAFTPEEWAGIKTLPGAVSMYIITASPAIGDAMKESMALAKNLADPAQKASAAGLLKAVLDEFTDSSSAKASQPKYEGAKDMPGLRAMILDDITKKTALVDAKAEANEAKDFKMWLYKVANDTAEAAKEGDFMGIGGVKVNQAEKDALAQLATVMGVQAA
ncbi:MAG: hypothetical protein KIS84_14105 [Dokdonella sp.]|nr:hypothetical protein [Dokdonella sp.]